MKSTQIDWTDALDGCRVIGTLPADVTGVFYDSRQVVPGSLFVAVPGAMPPLSRDGHDFLSAAVDRGAAALVVQADRREQWESLQDGRVALIVAPDSRRALARLAAAYNGYPARQLRTIGVTGTDGKTTTVHMTASALAAAGASTGFLSSVEFQTSGDPQINATHMTTLQSPEVQTALAEMVDAGREYAVIEASSHGLALNRVDDCEFDVAVFTTLSADHLDFHRTLDDYLAAKGRLFEMLDESVDKGVAKTAVLNADDPASARLRARTRARALTYGIEAAADVRAEDVSLQGFSSTARLRTSAGDIDLTLPVPGLYSVYDALAAVAVGLAFDLPLATLAEGLLRFRGVPGRMEMIDCGQPFQVVVDIASTPDALRRVLEVLRSQTQGRLIAVFGCAGERDRGRRDGMGRVAGELADFVILTNEDPRTEDPDAIVSEIAAGLIKNGRHEGNVFARVLDRRAALREAFRRAHAGDVVLLAGKGTEQSIVVGREHYPWDERVVARELLGEMFDASQPA